MDITAGPYNQYYGHKVTIIDFIIMPKNNNVSKEISMSSSSK